MSLDPWLSAISAFRWLEQEREDCFWPPLRAFTLSHGPHFVPSTRDGGVPALSGFLYLFPAEGFGRVVVQSGFSFVFLDEIKPV